MQYLWETADIHVGRRVHSWNRAEEYIIGYDPSVDSTTERRCLVSLIDGKVQPKGLSEDGLAKWLNKGGYKPVALETEDVLPGHAASRLFVV